ncbi:hypothetical protein LEP1GSC191_3649 [Leptospira borgpetersenii serovar Mini str. 201000851]|nr:hypothetical protein LEP1GSC191_3649 [Leptospira borgpetersenii serovar Mini str. 201000851]
MAGIIYRMKTGCQWRVIPSNFGSGSQKIPRMGASGSIQKGL